MTSMTGIPLNPILALYTCLLDRALMGRLKETRNNLNSTRGAMLELLIFSVIPFLYTVTRR